MNRGSNRRRPRSAAPERPDLREKAERMHAEIFGSGEQPEPLPPRRGGWGGWGGWLRYVAAFSLAALAWVLGEKLNNYRLLMLALAMAGSSVGVIIVRIIVARKRRK